MKWGMIGSVWGMRLGRLFGKEHRPDGTVTEFPVAGELARKRVIEDIGASNACELEHLRELVVELRDRLADQAREIKRLECLEVVNETLDKESTEWRRAAIQEAKITQAQTERIRELVSQNAKLQCSLDESEADNEDHIRRFVAALEEEGPACFTNCERDELRKRLQHLRSEINCRREHGIKSGTEDEHFLYIEEELKSIVEYFHVPF